MVSWQVLLLYICIISRCIFPSPNNINALFWQVLDNVKFVACTWIVMTAAWQVPVACNLKISCLPTNLELWWIFWIAWPICTSITIHEVLCCVAIYFFCLYASGCHFSARIRCPFGRPIYRSWHPWSNIFDDLWWDIPLCVYRHVKTRAAGNCLLLSDEEKKSFSFFSINDDDVFLRNLTCRCFFKKNTSLRK